MNWICIGILAGSLIVSGHDSREACEGRVFSLKEAKADAKCVERPGSALALSPYTSCCTMTLPTR